MKLIPRPFAAALLLPFCHSSGAQESSDDPRVLSEVFSKYQAEGTIVIVDERGGAEHEHVFNKTRALKRFTPASSFKIPHALFALDAGIVRDEFQVLAWDGKKRSYEAWNHDQTIRSSMRHSVVWVYEGFAKAIGEDGEREYLRKIDYGNADPSGNAPFWIEGNLRVSAYEQVVFLKRLYENKLPFAIGHQRLVKDIMIQEAGADWILRAKTGWSGTIGWWVGWVEHPTGPVFFALNIETPGRLDDLHKRTDITREILTSLEALPKRTMPGLKD